MVPTVSQAKRSVSGDVAQIWSFNTVRDESNQVASWLAADMASRGTKPRDYAILVKQKAADFEKQLQAPLAAVGLAVRNESKLVGRISIQDLLGEPYVELAVAILRLASQRQAPAAWALASDVVVSLRATDREDQGAFRAAEMGLTNFIASVRRSMATSAPSPDAAEDIAAQVLAFADQGALARTYPQYAAGDGLELAIEAFRIHLAASASGAADWSNALNRFEGIDQLPLMTIHKSKGLEYDTILFLGLDDGQWWSYSAGDPEGLATFFVALSRAKQCAIFTFCGGRGGRTKVADLYGLLQSAGVPEIKC